MIKKDIHQDYATHTTETSECNQDVLDAMDEAKKIAHDPSIKGYTNLNDLIAALDEADLQAETTAKRLSHEAVFANARKVVHGE